MKGHHPTCRTACRCAVCSECSCLDGRVSWESAAQEPPAEGQGIPREGCPEAREPRKHRALRWDSVPREEHLRHRTSLKKPPQQRKDSQLPGAGASPSCAEEPRASPRSTSLILPFSSLLLGLFQGSKSHKRDLLEGSGS